MLMPYGQKERGDFISIDIYALRAKERTKFKKFMISNNFFATTKVIKFSIKYNMCLHDEKIIKYFHH